MLAHFVAAEHAADPQGDAGLAAQGLALTLGGRGYLLQLALSGGQQVNALARTRGGQQWIAAGDQALAGIGRVYNLGEVALIEQ